MLLTSKQEAFAQAYQNSKSFDQAAAATGATYSKGSGYYVYFLIDPTTQEIFYVGNGKGNRVSNHVKNAINGNIDNAEKHKRITKIISDGVKVQEFIFEHYDVERDAFACEKFFIEAIRYLGITNIANGVMTNEEKESEQAKFLLTQLAPVRWLNSYGKPEMREVIEARFGSFEAYDDFLRGALNKLIIPPKVEKSGELAYG